MYFTKKGWLVETSDKTLLKIRSERNRIYPNKGLKTIQVCSPKTGPEVEASYYQANPGKWDAEPELFSVPPEGC